MLLVCIYISIHFYMIPNRSNSWQRLHHVSQMAVNTYCCISLLYLLYLPLLLLSSTFVLQVLQIYLNTTLRIMVRYARLSVNLESLEIIVLLQKYHFIPVKLSN